MNSLCARFPQIRFELGSRSSHSPNMCEFNGGYVFLPCCKDFPSLLFEDELIAFKAYWREQGLPNVEAWPNVVCHWAKLQLPNGQNAQSVWFVSTVNTKVCCSSCVEVSPLRQFHGILNINKTLADQTRRWYTHQ
jgi:hypothetical protein